MQKARVHPNLLKTVPPFAWFTDGQFQWIAPTIQHRTYPSHTPINVHGLRENGVYVVLSGRVRLAVDMSDGREFIASVVRPNDFFGEVGLFANGAEVVVARTMERSDVAYVPGSVLLRCFHENPKAALCMLQAVTKRLSTSYQKLANVAFTKVSQRVAVVLLEHLGGTGGDASVQVGSEQIAALVGCSREMVSRVIRRMTQQGIARKTGRRLVVLQSQALFEQAGLSERRTELRMH